jgi:hypothetical protein
MSTIKRNIRVTDDKIIANEIEDLKQAAAVAREFIPAGRERFAFDVGMVAEQSRVASRGKPVAARFGLPPATAQIGGRDTMIGDSLDRSGR